MQAGLAVFLLDTLEDVCVHKFSQTLHDCMGPLILGGLVWQACSGHCVCSASGELPIGEEAVVAMSSL